MDTNQNNTENNMIPENTSDHPIIADTTTVSEESYHFWAEEHTSAEQQASNLQATDTPVTTAPEAVSPAEVPQSVIPQPATQEPVATAPLSDEAPKKKKHNSCFMKKFVACIGLAACFGVVAGGAFFGVKYAVSALFPEKAEILETETDKHDFVSQKQNITIASTSISEVGDTDATETVAAVVEQTMPAMVSIQTVITESSYFFGRPIYNEREGGGSGIIVGSNENDLLIATNHHVIDGTTAVKVILADGTSHDVTVKGTDAGADLAILALPLSGLTQETLDSIDIAVLGDSDGAKIGQMVIAIGNALGYGPSVTVGYLSAKDREITIEGNDMVLLQTNAAINSGNSGGALLNTKGEVIGINNAKLTSTEIEGICFAIPISMATPILDDLMTREILADDEKGYLGITVTVLNSAVTESYHWPEGVFVSAVAEDSAAQKAGVYVGDIITHVNGIEVTTSNQLVNEVTSHRYGTEIEITLQRVIEGEFVEYTLPVTLQQNPELISSEEAPSEQKPSQNKPR